MADEKQEKSDEKEMEKRDEKSPPEKSWDEKWARDPLNAVVWALIFIWAGLVFLASNLGYLGQISSGEIFFPGVPALGQFLDAWPLVFIGAGVILLISVVIRLLVPAYRKPVVGAAILGFIFLGIGLGDLINWGIIWAVILIIVGISVLARGVRRSRKEE